MVLIHALSRLSLFSFQAGEASDDSDKSQSEVSDAKQQEGVGSLKCRRFLSLLVSPIDDGWLLLF